MNEELLILKEYKIPYLDKNKTIKGLPIIFEKSYNFRYIDIYEKEILIMSKKRKISLERYVEDSIYMLEKLKCPIVLLINNLDEIEIKRLISNGISFISDTVIYIPFLGTVIEVNMSPTIIKKPFTLNQQRLLIYILLQDKDEIYPQELSDNLNLSIANIYRLLKYFNELGFVKSTHGEYVFLKSRKDIYLESKLNFVNPVENTVNIPKTFLDLMISNNVSIFKSGIDAMSAYTMLATNNKVFGVEQDSLLNLIEKYKDNDSINEENHLEIEHVKRILQSAMKHNVNSFYNYREEVKLEIWSYNPLMSNSNILDPITLSLLNIEDDGDPRVQEAKVELEEVIIKTLINLDRIE